MHPDTMAYLCHWLGMCISRLGIQTSCVGCIQTWKTHAIAICLDVNSMHMLMVIISTGMSGATDGHSISRFDAKYMQFHSHRHMRLGICTTAGIDIHTWDPSAIAWTWDVHTSKPMPVLRISTVESRSYTQPIPLVGQ